MLNSPQKACDFVTQPFDLLKQTDSPIKPNKLLVIRCFDVLLSAEPA